MHLSSTLLACELRVTLDALEFRPRSRQRAFTSRGIERSRLLPMVGDPSTLGVDGFRIGRVYLQLEPDQREPEEYDPTSPGYAELCWVKYPRPSSTAAAPTDGAAGAAAQ